MQTTLRIFLRLFKGVLLLCLVLSVIGWVSGYFCTLWVYLGPRWPGHGLNFEIRPGRFVVGAALAPDLVRGDDILVERRYAFITAHRSSFNGDDSFWNSMKFVHYWYFFENLVAIPWWFLSAATSTGLFLLQWRQRRKLAQSQGLCRDCHYDLRAHKSGDKCPECGTLIPPSSDAIIHRKAKEPP